MNPNLSPLLHYLTVWGLSLIAVALLVMALVAEFRTKRLVTIILALLVAAAAAIITLAPHQL